ncbi:phospholipase A2 inhibitor and Ly6/PLAUR domain-containing protein-like [Leptodactylus fuscus]
MVISQPSGSPSFSLRSVDSGIAVRCMKCKAIGKNDCTGESVECEHKDDFCTTAIEHNHYRGHMITTVSRGCKNSSILCNGPILMTANEVWALASFFQCCHTDNCNSGKIEMPLLNYTTNGLSCLSCYEEGSYSCQKYEPLPCIGDQEDCFDFSGLGARPGHKEVPYAIAGCAKKGACKIKYDALVGSKVGHPNKLTFPLENRMQYCHG